MCMSEEACLICKWRGRTYLQYGVKLGKWKCQTEIGNYVALLGTLEYTVTAGTFYSREERVRHFL